MSPQQIRSLRHLEGHHITARLGEDGAVFRGELVSTPRRGADTVWLHAEQDDDIFVSPTDLYDIREMA